MYIRFPGHIWGHGLNNVLQETLLMSYLAYRTNRSFVFEDYTWSHTPLPYTIYDFALRPPRLPLNAFISGPSAGGPMPPSANARAAVSAEHWEKVCPPARRRIVSSKDAPHSAEGDVLIRWWVDTLAAVPDSCVEIDSSSQVVFDRYFFGEPRILSLWDSLITSPILTEFTWSPLVHSAVARNFPMLQPRSAKALMDVSAAGTLDGLVAVHLRRGDYKRHCPRLAGWGTAYMGVNQAPELPDRLDALALANMTGADRHAEYMAHCLPSVAQVAERLRALRAANPGLRRVYVLTNGWGWWVAGLKKKLLEDGWDDMKSSLELVLDEEQSYVAMAVDMAIAEKAEVFLGNGFSSLTSNVVMLRRAKGLAASSNRFL
ncbi:hypothetical protein PLICRDRAFT_32724 [Plicaturopsis crispa FD-325 SS-3]|uniref:Uncharacterized protein n=1 Tax=Plicaturopsis crispa FD-325 SS-3 TaxID=944288 RepID=A0A0C9SWJ1_PLICR|nr:hypothetical protein PLICRDRAFT_32724 [Plicaturopsis crispa FD-325 SS-3]